MIGSLLLVAGVTAWVIISTRQSTKPYEVVLTLLSGLVPTVFVALLVDRQDTAEKHAERERRSQYQLALGLADNLTNRNLAGLDLVGLQLPSRDLSNIVLSGADLAGSNFAMANLTGAVLTGANLTGANLHEATLTMAEVAEADLTGVDLINADLREVNAWAANLSGADLSGADLRGADLDEAELAGVKWHPAEFLRPKWPDGFDPPKNAWDPETDG